MRALFLLIAFCAHWNGEKISQEESKWYKKLGKERYHILRQKGTEAPFMGAYVFTETQGQYACAACLLPLFHSKNKYDAKSGWPSFTSPVCPYHVYYLEDRSLGWKCYEVLCRRCNSHLGHIFADGPPQEGKNPPYFRYCINSLSLQFFPAKM